MTIKLYGFWRSLATFRVRAALNLKGLPYVETIIDLNAGEQHGEAFHQVNPQHVLPALDHDGLVLTQSMPIVEYLDETFPDEPLLPADAAGRARVRSIAQIAVADVHPLITPRIRTYLEHELGVAEPERMAWIRHWFEQGSKAIEARLTEPGAPQGPWAHGSRPTLADLALVSHVAGARLFNADLSAAPRLVELAEACLQIDAIGRAHPLQQAGAPKP